METKDYTTLVPFTPPEGLLDWTMEHAEEMTRNILVYKADWARDAMTGERYRTAKLWCSACEETTCGVYVGGECCHNGLSCAPFGFLRDWEDSGKAPEVLYSGKETVCPHCGAKVRAQHCGGFRSEYCLGEAWPMTVDRVEDKLVLTGWSVCRSVRACTVPKPGAARREYQTCAEIRPYEAYVVDRKKIVRLKGYEKYISTVIFLSKWHQIKRYSDEWGITKLIYPWNKQLLIGTTAENCKLDRYLRASGDSRPITYLSCWVRHPNVENLIMQGAGSLFNDMLDRATTQYYYGSKDNCSVSRILDVDWKQRRPAQMLRLTKDEFRAVVQNKLDLNGLRMVISLREHGQALKTDDEYKACKAFGCEGARLVAEDGEQALKVIRYIGRQIGKYPREKERIAYTTLKDYWKMAEKLGEDLKDPAVKWPQHLIASHDAALMRQKFKQQERLRAGFQRVYEQLRSLAWSADGLTIRPCRDENELIIEGKTLCHCVARYAETHAKGEDCIFFIRQEDRPDCPYFTLELDVKRLSVIQNRGRSNCARTPEVSAFEKKWLEHIREMKSTETHGAHMRAADERKAG